MRQFVQRNEQYLFQIVADLLKQKTELEKLRVVVWQRSHRRCS
jgi:hypothetical protein